MVVVCRVVCQAVCQRPPRAPRALRLPGTQACALSHQRSEHSCSSGGGGTDSAEVPAVAVRALPTTEQGEEVCSGVGGLISVVFLRIFNG